LFVVEVIVCHYLAGFAVRFIHNKFEGIFGVIGFGLTAFEADTVFMGVGNLFELFKVRVGVGDRRFDGCFGGGLLREEEKKEEECVHGG